MKNLILVACLGIQLSDEIGRGVAILALRQQQREIEELQQRLSQLETLMGTRTKVAQMNTLRGPATAGGTQ